MLVDEKALIVVEKICPCWLMRGLDYSRKICPCGEIMSLHLLLNILYNILTIVFTLWWNHITWVILKSWMNNQMTPQKMLLWEVWKRPQGRSTKSNTIFSSFLLSMCLGKWGEACFFGSFPTFWTFYWKLFLYFNYNLLWVATHDYILEVRYSYPWPCNHLSKNVWLILWCGDHPMEYLVKFGYKQNMKVKKVKYPFIFLTTY